MKSHSFSPATGAHAAAHDDRQVDFPFCAWSVALILLSDWLLFAVNVLTDLSVLPMVVVSGGLAAGLSVALLEALTGDASLRNAALKGLAAAVLVAAPLPMLGTLLATFGLIWATVVALTRRSRTLAPAKAH